MQLAVTCICILQVKPVVHALASLCSWQVRQHVACCCNPLHSIIVCVSWVSNPCACMFVDLQYWAWICGFAWHSVVHIYSCLSSYNAWLCMHMMSAPDHVLYITCHMYMHAGRGQLMVRLLPMSLAHGWRKRWQTQSCLWWARSHCEDQGIFERRDPLLWIYLFIWWSRRGWQKKCEVLILSWMEAALYVIVAAKPCKVCQSC